MAMSEKLSDLIVFIPEQWRGDVLTLLCGRVLAWNQAPVDAVLHAQDHRKGIL